MAHLLLTGDLTGFSSFRPSPKSKKEAVMLARIGKFEFNPYGDTVHALFDP